MGADTGRSSCRRPRLDLWRWSRACGRADGEASLLASGGEAVGDSSDRWILNDTRRRQSNREVVLQDQTVAASFSRPTETVDPARGCARSGAGAWKGEGCSSWAPRLPGPDPERNQTPVRTHPVGGDRLFRPVRADRPVNPWSGQWANQNFQGEAGRLSRFRGDLRHDGDVRYGRPGRPGRFVVSPCPAFEGPPRDGFHFGVELPSLSGRTGTLSGRFVDRLARAIPTIWTRCRPSGSARNRAQPQRVDGFRFAAVGLRQMR